jgi:acetyltransferase-like isoleucine patch superfamily enzyme
MKIGVGTNIHPLTNIYCESIGINCTVANFVEIGKDVVIGDFCSIQAFAYIPEGVTLGDNVFVGPHVCFTNCKYPSANLKKVADLKKLCGETRVFHLETTLVEDDVMIGAGSVILCGITIGKGATIGAGSIITRDVPANAKVIQKRIGSNKEPEFLAIEHYDGRVERIRNPRYGRHTNE